MKNPIIPNLLGNVLSKHVLVLHVVVLVVAACTKMSWWWKRILTTRLIYETNTKQVKQH